jgi:hypothetical protein
MNLAGASTVLCRHALLVAALAASAFAQESNAIAVEGYVFDQKTLRPLANTFVTLSQLGVDGIGRGLSVPTNSNGFYALTLVPPVDSVSNDLKATCHTKRGPVESVSPIYLPLQTDRVYQRNFYISLPRSVTRCQ